MKLSRWLIASLGIVLSQGAAHAVPRLVIPYKIPREGKNVRLRLLYDARLQPLTSAALMKTPAVLDQSNYENLRDYAQAIMTKFPPSQYYYVGVGRTAGPVIAFLKNVSPHIAANFPSSGMSEGVYEQNPANYQTHLETLLPEDVRKGDRKVVLIDQSSGRSLRGLSSVFDAYRARGGSIPQTELLTLGHQAEGLHSINLGQDFWKDREEIAEFIGEQDDGGHIMHSNAGSLDKLKRNPVYAEHRRKLFARMARDATFDAFLRAQFPTLVK